MQYYLQTKNPQYLPNSNHDRRTFVHTHAKVHVPEFLIPQPQPFHSPIPPSDHPPLQISLSMDAIRKLNQTLNIWKGVQLESVIVCNISKSVRKEGGVHYPWANTKGNSFHFVSGSMFTSWIRRGGESGSLLFKWEAKQGEKFD
ncbi:hypothetical protein CDAR_42461 [Caerostris darwini]|uniref:Uncharacterized protein n=1 Tax=Caerostris darwini TaxID=1538125 RepID=A0AAV4RGK3_9ARAC|nr:hypothetical protein CDAR_42461 [Caerostris darwini]